MKDVTNSSQQHAKKSHRNFLALFNRMGFNALYILLFVLAFLYYYIALPPIHYAAFDFWFFLGLIVVGIIVIEVLKDGSSFVFNRSQNTSTQLKSMSIKYKVLFGILPVALVIWLVSSAIFSPFFMASSYRDMLPVAQADFETEFSETDVNQIPLIDRDTAVRLGNRKLGALTNLVSQFVASPEYVQININNYPYRVTPLEYAGFFKWLNNFSEGIPHYLKVDNVTGEVTVETPEAPIKYSYADKFWRNINRHLRFKYPFTIFGKPSFEVDDEGTPYYIASTYGRNFFLFEPEVTGLVVVNASTGESKHYSLEEIPQWVDRVYSADLVLHQLQMHGKYVNGFWNTLFSNEGVTQPTEGYNYLPMNDDLYLYTGITSINADESNIGFVLVNLRTKEAKMYPISAAEEFSAMSSAEGSVQEKGYTATFPLLINLSGKPVYVLSLKDSSGLIKAYALVDVQNYQTVYVESSVEKLLLSYAAENPVDIEELETEEELLEVVGAVENVQAVVKSGNTVYYFMIDGKVYQAPIQLNDSLPFLNDGTEVKMGVSESGEVRSIEWDDAKENVTTE